MNKKKRKGDNIKERDCTKNLIKKKWFYYMKIRLNKIYIK